MLIGDNAIVALFVADCYRSDMPANVLDILSEHERALEARLKSLREQTILLERELADVRRARGAISPGYYGPEQAQIPFPAGISESASIQPPISASSPYARATIKELVRKALGEHFVDGATANQLLHFFADAWGRKEIVRTSLSPQLSRLKAAGEIVLHGQRWSLTELGQAGELRPNKAAADQ